MSQWYLGSTRIFEMSQRNRDRWNSSSLYNFNVPE